MAEVKAGRIVLPDLVQNLSFHVSGEEKLKTVGRALNDIANGTKANEYISDQETMVRRLIDSYEQFERIQSRSSAGELIKSFNALKAVTNEIDLSKIVQNFEKVDAAYQKASADFGKDFTGFSVDRFRDVAEAMAELAHHGVDVDKVFERLGQSSNVGKLHEQINELQNTVGRLSKELNNVTRQRDELLSGDEIQRLKELESNFENITGRMANEFRSFLVANDLDSDDAAWGKYYEYFESIRNGSMTAKEAIANVREELAEMIRQAEPGDTIFKSSQMEEFISKMNIACETIEYMRAEIEDLSNKISLRAVAQEMGESAKLTEEQRQAMHGLIEEGAGLNNLSQILVALIQNFDTTDERVHTSVNSFQELLKVLDSIAHVEPANMSGFNDVLKNLRMITEFEIDSKKMKELEESLTTLSKIPDLSNIALLGSVDLRGFNDLKASKASLSNLATYLPELSQNVNVEKLQALSQISLANFDSENLKVSKASMDHLRELIQTISGTQLDPNNAGANNAAGDTAQKLTQEIQKEADAIRSADAEYKSHVSSIEDAAKAEADKAKISDLLAQALKREEERTETSAQAAKKHADLVRQQEDAMWDAYRAEENLNNKTQAQIDAEIEREIAAHNKKADAEAAASEKAQRAWEKEEAAAIAAADRKVEAEEKAAQKRAEAAQRAAEKAAEAEQKAAEKAAEAARKAEEQKLKAAEKAEEQRQKAAEKAAAAEQKASEKAAEAARKAAEEAAKAAQKSTYDDAKRAINRYYGLQTSVYTNAAKRNDVTLGADGWMSQSGQYEKLTAELNAAKTAYDLYTDSKNKSVLSDQQIAALNELNAQRQREYALAVEATDAAEQRRAQKAEELAQKKQAEAEATRAAKEAKEQEAAATKAAAEAEREEARARKESEQAAADAEREEIAAQRQKNTMLRQLNTMLAQCEAAQRKYAAAAKLGIAKDDYSKLQGYVTQIRQMENALRSGGSTAKDLSGDFDRLRLSISDTTTALKTNTNLIGSWATTGMQQLKSRLTYSFGLAAMVYKAANEIKKMISTAVELDSAMNQLQIVTRSSGAEMDTYAKRVSAMAKETAQATKDLIDATTVYARLGYSMDESASLAKYTAMLQGVGNIEASAAQDAMTAILKAFNKNVEDVEDIMNKMVVVGKELPKTVVTQFQ